MTCDKCLHSEYVEEKAVRQNDGISCETELHIEGCRQHEKSVVHTCWLHVSQVGCLAIDIRCMSFGRGTFVFVLHGTCQCTSEHSRRCREGDSKWWKSWQGRLHNTKRGMSLTTMPSCIGFVYHEYFFRFAIPRASNQLSQCIFCTNAARLQNFTCLTLWCAHRFTGQT